SVAPHIKSGRLRALAVTSTQRSAAFPDLPTLDEAGVPGYQAESWYGIYAPAGTPEDVIARLNASVAKAVQTPSFQQRVADEGLIVDVAEYPLEPHRPQKRTGRRLCGRARR